MIETPRPLDLAAIEEKWLRQCGACDAGMSTSCVCADGDPRNVIANLVDEVRQLRTGVLHAANAALTTVDTMRQEAAEAREIIGHRGEDECPGWLDRANALDEYADKIAASLRSVEEYLPAVLRPALHITSSPPYPAPGDGGAS